VGCVLTTSLITIKQNTRFLKNWFHETTTHQRYLNKLLRVGTFYLVIICSIYIWKHTIFVAIWITFKRLKGDILVADDVKLNQSKKSVMMNPMSSEATNHQRTEL
jgi:hypothetical protein